MKTASLLSTALLSLGLLAGCTAEATSEAADTDAVPSVSDSTVSPKCRAIIAGKDVTDQFPCEATPGSGAGEPTGGGGGFTPRPDPRLICVNACNGIQANCITRCNAGYGAKYVVHKGCAAACVTSHTSCVKDCG